MAHRRIEPACPERCDGRCAHPWHDQVHDPASPYPPASGWALVAGAVALAAAFAGVVL